jgi:hypothetical protein
MLTTAGFRTASWYNSGRLRAAGVDARRDSSAGSPIRSAAESENDSVRRPSEASRGRGTDAAAPGGADPADPAAAEAARRGVLAAADASTGANTNATPNASGIGRFANSGGGYWAS